MTNKLLSKGLEFNGNHPRDKVGKFTFKGGSSKLLVSKSANRDDKDELQKSIDKAKREKKDSFEMHTINGKLTPERQKLHDKIVEQFLGKEQSNTGTIYMMGGATANGKSTLTNSGLLPHPKNVLVVDPDGIKLQIPEYSHMLNKNDAKAAAFVHEESSYLSKRVIDESIKKGNDFLVDGIGDGSFDSLEKKIKNYGSTGKRVRADYVTLDTKLSLKLAKERALKTGRKVPATYIKHVNREVSKIVPALIEKNTLHELYLWDTNINGNPRLILKHINGKTDIQNPDLYKRFLDKGKEY